ncbi:ABC transporter substrate-binding protein [Klenkia taihuensis]|uniref:Raffinose/stachyose/melibiose transport system substrate-binding protein n=1 Tax=Klenkia taihuensis TaxID=1225127 RepID=A0A1I1G6U8_9ACTN|nr:extracellular solute-binding protein [Klenkia taihuensis]SFC07499.1 raffinose/stachyose/melibiose transport system substrate-binding protein [Klenkia taihuensis]
MNTRTGRRLVTRAVVGASALSLVLLAGCSAPGADGSASGQDEDREISTELTSEDVELDFYIETGFPIAQELADEFTEQHPNITFNIRSDQFAVLTENASRVMAGDDAPDLIRLPQLVDPARDGLLLDLDPYFDAYGWDAFPESQLQQMRISDDARGSGSLYGMGIGYSVTGVYWNKAIGAQLGITEAPTTIDELEADMATAAAAGQQPIMQFNDIGGIAFPFQALYNQLADPTDIADWTFQQPGATIDNPEATEAMATIQEWADAGYFPADANSLDYTTMMGRFSGGEGLFMFNGDWESANLAESMGDDVGFFLMPGTEAGAAPVAMGAPNSYTIPAKAEHPDEAAFFLNWLHTDETARSIIVNSSGANPGGPTDLEIPEAANPLTEQTLAAGATVGSDGTLVDFVANATAGIYAGSIRPELQSLIDDRTTPEDAVAAIQAAYEDEVGS